VETSESEEIFGEGSIPDVFLDSGVKLPIFYASDSSTAIFQEYKSKKKENFRLVSLIPSLFVFYFATATRFRLARYGQDGPRFLCLFVLYLMETTLFTTFVVARVVIAFTPKSYRDRLSYNYCQKYIIYGFFCRMEDYIGVIVTLVNGTCLLARVNAGQCADSVSIWETDSCNPVAALRAFPCDQIFLCSTVSCERNHCRGRIAQLDFYCIFRGICYLPSVSMGADVDRLFYEYFHEHFLRDGTILSDTLYS
jgi:hypothetical protein